MEPTLVCPRGCTTGFGPVTQDFEALGGRKNAGMMIMTLTAECHGCGQLCDSELVGPINEFHLTISTGGR